ncbi:ESCO1/2 acetyl-transferase-domain-containing protein [Peziza echinospora]|nr:ESCO1/2 acetyl-transferase-domain-containing protein [Peziza echinospora]
MDSGEGGEDGGIHKTGRDLDSKPQEKKRGYGVLPPAPLPMPRTYSGKKYGGKRGREVEAGSGSGERSVRVKSWSGAVEVDRKTGVGVGDGGGEAVVEKKVVDAVVEVVVDEKVKELEKDKEGIKEKEREKEKENEKPKVVGKKGTIEGYFMKMGRKDAGKAGQITTTETASTTTTTITVSKAEVPLKSQVPQVSERPSTPMRPISLEIQPPHSPTPPRSPSPPPPSSFPSLLRTRKRNHNTSSRSSHPPTKKLLQLHLDLGGAPLRQTCPECQMSYIPCTPEDELLHRRYHSKIVGGVDFPLPPTSAQDEGITVVWRDTESQPSSSGAALVVSITHSARTAVRKRVSEVMDVVARELGTDDVDVWGDGAGGGWGLRGGKGYIVYLYLIGKKCVGMCLAERISKAYKVVPPASVQSSTSSLATSTFIRPITTLSPSTQAAVTTEFKLSDKPHKAHLGISRIWTCNSFRRRGIALRLVECARGAFVYGMMVERGLVAFSQPTKMGESLARRWAAEGGGEVEWAVYMEEDDQGPGEKGSEKKGR